MTKPKKQGGNPFGTHVNQQGQVVKNKGHQTGGGGDGGGGGDKGGSGGWGGGDGWGGSGWGGGTSLTSPPPVSNVDARPGSGFGDLGRGAPSMFDGLAGGGGGGEGTQISGLGNTVAGMDVETAVGAALAQGAKKTKKTGRAGSL